MNGRPDFDATWAEMGAYREARKSAPYGNCFTDSDQVLQSWVVRAFSASVVANGQPEDGDESDDGKDEQ